MEKTFYYENTIKEAFKKNEFINLLGMELLEINEGYAKGKIEIKPHHTNLYGSVHGGCLFSLADTVAGIAACTYGNYSSTISGNMNYLKPAINTKNIYCIATVSRQGKSISVYNVEIINDNKEIIQTGSFTFYMLSKKL